MEESVSEGLGLQWAGSWLGINQTKPPAVGASWEPAPNIAHSLTPRASSMPRFFRPSPSRSAGGGAFRVPAVGYAVGCG